MAEQMGFDFTEGATGAPEKMTKEQRWKQIAEEQAIEDRQNAQRDKEKVQDKAKARAAENEDFADKRTPKSELFQKAEMAKIKAAENARDAAKTARAQSSMISPQGNTTAAGRGTAYGGGDLEKGMAGSRFKPLAKAKGGMVKSSASKRADGCAIRGKTRA